MGRHRGIRGCSDTVVDNVCSIDAVHSCRSDRSDDDYYSYWMAGRKEQMYFFVLHRTGPDCTAQLMKVAGEMQDGCCSAVFKYRSGSSSLVFHARPAYRNGLH